MILRVNRFARVVSGMGVCASLLSMPTQALALECPMPQPLTRPGILKETPAQTTELANLLASGDDDNRIHVVIHDLRTRYPGIENAEIVNYLMAAYCPTVAQLTGLGPQEQQARTDRFLGQVVRIVH